MFSKQKGNETMTHKKSDSKPIARSRLSLASRLLGGALRNTLPVTASEEPWRTKKRTGKHRGKRQK
jgi:hypothetical protein